MPTRFDRFDFDEKSGDLGTDEGVVRLPPQVAAVLEMLVSRAGDVVTRDELKAKLWPDTTVEFDDGLNFCIRQLRVALGDDASQPRFIETLPKRGYRFIAPVADVPTVDVVIPEAAGLSRRNVWLVCGLLAVIYLGASYRDWYGRPWTFSSQPPKRFVLAVMPFDADPADSALTRYQRQLGEALVATLTPAAGDRASIIGPLTTARFSGTRTPVDTLARALSATHVLSGTVRPDSGRMLVFAQLIQVSDRRHLYGARQFDSLPRGVRLTSIADSIGRAVLRTIRR